MSSGKQHSAASAVIGSMMILPAILYYPPGLFVSIGCFLGILLTPDLDIQNPVYSHYMVGKIGRYAGRIIEFILMWTWRLFWYPYSVSIPRHRHWASHFPIVGTIGRLLYISLFVSFFVVFYPDILLPFVDWYILYIVIGIMVSDIAHWIMDGFPIYS